MGCCESRKLIENVSIPSDIKTVYHLDDNFAVDKHRSKVEAEVKSELRPEEYANVAERIKLERQLRNQKFKTKYDPRITAKYDIKALIGKGTFSKVVRVENKLTKQPYAIKIIESEEGREAFEAELAILRRVKCPYIIQLVEVFESVDKIYMVMELATGGDLFDKIMTKGPFSENDAIATMKNVLEGVKYLHNLGITHRDLKPDNLLYYHPGRDSRLMITDFGLAHTRKSANDVLMSTICGTPEYVAPEIVARRHYTHAVDLWAVGVITYILLRGDFPFFDDSRVRLYKKILKGSYDISDEVWKEVSENGRDFVGKLLEVDPETRLTAEEALRHPWILTNHHTSRSKQANSPSGSWGRRSARSSHSSRSALSAQSLRTDRRRIRPHELESLGPSSPRPAHGYRTQRNNYM